ncbi:MAG: hypothetical protein JSU95_16695 [Betaproteobacteria bacterium]|nr:MAG: hypothetical protein JSU95_16695 [Betaproteobacteria bacterium]
MKICKVLFAALLGAGLSACGSQAVKPAGDELPVYRINDGSRCAAPSGFADIVDAPATLQVRSLFLASAPPEEIVASIGDLPAHQYLDAAFYLSCGEYARGELSKAVFSRQRQIYQAFRLEHLNVGIQQWRETTDGFEFPGKVCHFIHNNGEPDMRDVTRLVPADTSVDDCAMFVRRNGGTHVLLGCSAGRWENQWAGQRLLAHQNGWANRRGFAAGTRYVPEPNCNWN